MKKLLSAVIFLLLCSSMIGQSLDKMKFITEEYPPYNFSKDGKPSGIAVDILIEIFKKLGIDKGLNDIEVTKWARGVKNVNEVPGTCLFSATLTKERKDVLGWKFVYPIPQVSEESNNHLIAPKSKNIKFNSVDDVKKYGKKFGVVRGDVGAGLLSEAGINHSLFDEASDPVSLVKKIDKGRFDIMSYGFTTALEKMKEVGIDGSKYEIVYTFPPAPMGFAFHKSTDQAVIQKFQKALDDLNADGTCAKIRKKYVK